MDKKTLFSILLCLIIGSISAFFLYKSYKNEEVVMMMNKENKIYFLQVGAYKNYDNVGSITKSLPNYLVIEENELYIIYVGITSDKANLKKLESLYKSKGFSTYVKTKNISNDFVNILNKYDLLLNETNDYEMIININKEVLKKYKEECM